MIKFAIVFIFLYLDGLISCYLPYISNKTFISVNFSLLAIFIIYFNCNNKIKYIFISFLIGLIYGIIYSLNPLFYGLLFLLIASLLSMMLPKKIYKKSIYFLKLCSLAVFYEIICYLFYFIKEQFNFNLYHLFYHVLTLLPFYIISFLILTLLKHKKVIGRNLQT